MLEYKFRVVRNDLMSVCVKRKAFLHNSNVSNNNMITEMKDNRIINVKNNAMTIYNWYYDKRKPLMSRCVS